MKKIIILFIIPFIFCSCQKNNIKYSQSENSVKECNKEILELIENKEFDKIISRDENIIKNSYSDKRIEKIIKDLENKKYKNIYDFAKDYCIEFIDIPPEVIRVGHGIVNNPEFYTIIAGEQIVYELRFAREEYEDNYESYNIFNHYYVNDITNGGIIKKSDLNLTDFQELEKKRAKLEEVEKKDPTGYYFYLHTSGYKYLPERSYNFSNDGYFIYIYYKWKKGGYVVDYIESKKVISDTTRYIWF